MPRTKFTIAQVTSRLMLASCFMTPGLSYAADITWSGFASVAACSHLFQQSNVLSSSIFTFSTV